MIFKMKKYLMVACLVVSFSANSLAFVQVGSVASANGARAELVKVRF